MLFRKCGDSNRLALSEKFKLDALKLCHDGIAGGYLGVRKTLNKDFFLEDVKMAKDVERYCKPCTACAKRKPGARVVGKLHPIQ